jgi:addiction module HigA family antidote
MSETMIPTHPGDVLKEELESRGISQKRFAEQTGVSYTMLNEILNGKRPVSTDFALIIEATLGINPQLLINMQARYNMAVSRKNKSFMQRLENLRKIAAVL